MTEREAEAYMRQGESAKGEIFQSRAQKSSPKIPLTNAQTVPGLQDSLGMRNSVSGICAHPQPVPSATYLRTGEPAAQSASGGEPHGAGREESTTKPAKRLGKTRRWSRLGKRFAFPSFPQPRRRSTSGYISNVSTDNPRVTFSNGLTRDVRQEVVEPTGRGPVETTI